MEGAKVSAFMCASILWYSYSVIGRACYMVAGLVKVY